MLDRTPRLLRPSLFGLMLISLTLGPLLRGQDLQSVYFDRLVPESSSGQSYPVVHGLIKDRRGFIWMVGSNILARYDGDSFFFFNREGDPGYLSGEMLFYVFEDSRGDIWVTSNRGLYLLKKEAGRFIRFRHDPSNPRTLSSDRTRAICEDKSGALWIGTVAGGVNRMDPDTRQFTCFLHDPSDRSSPGSDDILSLCSSKDGKIWMGAAGAGLDCYDPERGSWSHYPFMTEDPDGPADVRYLSLREGRDGRIWFGSSRSGLFWLDPSTAQFFRIDLGESEGQWRDYRVFSLHEDREGILWVGTENGGLYRFNPATQAFSRTTASPDQEGSGGGGRLSHNQVMSILEDREGLLWFGTANGISVFNKRRFRFPAIRPEPGAGKSPAAGEALCVLEDQNGILWVGTDKGGLKTLERRTGRWARADLNPEFSDRLMTVRIQAIAEDDRGDLWFGTSAGLYRYFRRTGAFIRYLDPARDRATLQRSGITALSRGRPGFLWVGSHEGGFFEWDIDAQKALFSPEIVGRRFSNSWINVVLVDSRGEVWVGTQWRGIVRFNPGTRRLSEYIHRPDDSRSLAHTTIHTIAEDESGGIWAGTEAGPCLYDAGRDDWIRLADDFGLSGRPVYAIVPDGMGNLWMSTWNELIKIQRESRLKRVYGAEDGLQSGRFNKGVGTRCRNGEIAFGGSSGIDCFQPRDVTDNPFLPPVAVSSVDLSSPPMTIPILDDKGEMIIPRSRFPLVVRISALSFSRPERQLFRVHMTSPEDRLFELGNERNLRLDTLKPGPSRFMIYAANHDGVWNPEGFSLTIRVTVPFWQSWVWRLVLAVLIAVAFWLWLRRRGRMLKQQLLHQIEGDLGPLSEHFVLTKREQEILALVLQGKSNKAIETELFISNKTVKNHLYNIYQKLGVKSRLELANAVREFSSKNRPPVAC